MSPGGGILCLILVICNSTRLWKENVVFKTYAKPKTMMKLTQCQGLVRPLLQSKTFKQFPKSRDLSWNFKAEK
jgi:hypothetical protein